MPSSDTPRLLTDLMDRFRSEYPELDRSLRYAPAAAPAAPSPWLHAECYTGTATQPLGISYVGAGTERDPAR